MKDTDFFKYCFKKMIDELRYSGDLQRCIRLMRALCLRLEKKPGILQNDEPLRHIYSAYCTLTGWWAAVHSHDETARAEFIAHSKRIYSDFPDFAIQAALLWDSHKPEASFKIFSVRECISESLVWTDAGPAFCLVEAAVDGHRAGISLTERSKELGGYTPTELIELEMDDSVTNRRGATSENVAASIAFCLALYGGLLLDERRLDDAWRAIEAAQEKLDLAGDGFRYIALRLRECRVKACQLEWEFSKSRESWKEYINELTATHKIAESLNLSKRIDRMHQL